MDVAHRYRATLDFLQTRATSEEIAPSPGDEDGDGDVDFDDFALFADVFNHPSVVFDFDGDGIVSFPDLFHFSDVFGTARP